MEWDPAYLDKHLPHEPCVTPSIKSLQDRERKEFCRGVLRLLYMGSLSQQRLIYRDILLGRFFEAGQLKFEQGKVVEGTARPD